MDETYKVAITRLGRPDPRRRYRGIGRIPASSCLPTAASTLERSLRDLFPRGGDLGGAVVLERLAADDAGRAADHRARRDTRIFYLNTGHGTLGWTMACGAAHITADRLLGRQPLIPTDGLSLDRYR